MTEQRKPNYEYIKRKTDEQLWLYENERYMTKDERKQFWHLFGQIAMAEVDMSELYKTVKSRSGEVAE